MLRMKTKAYWSTPRKLFVGAQQYMKSDLAAALKVELKKLYWQDCSFLSIVHNSDKHLDPTRPDPNPTRPDPIFRVWSLIFRVRVGSGLSVVGSGSGRVWDFKFRVQIGSAPYELPRIFSIFLQFSNKIDYFFFPKGCFWLKNYQYFRVSGRVRVRISTNFGSRVWTRVQQKIVGFRVGSGLICDRVGSEKLDPRPDRVGSGKPDPMFITVI